jgi:DNA-binding HxlR family transcriptional regulator
LPLSRSNLKHQTEDQATTRSNCPIACTLDLVGDRWTLLVIRDLMRQRSRFGELLESPERIPTNILADRLKRLERAAVISSACYNEHPPRYEYALTEKGLELGRTINALASWGLKYVPGTRVGEGLVHHDEYKRHLDHQS